MLVRWAEVSDAEALRALNEAFNGDGVSTASEVAASLRENPCERVAVCEVDGALAGFLCAQVARSMCYRDRTAQMTELYVDPRHRRRGAASALIGFVEDALRVEGIDGFWLLTGASNMRAQGLYEQLGYARVGEVMYGKGYEG